jgi:hypothetical protein
MDIHSTGYLQYRAKTRGFDLTQLEEILLNSLKISESFTYGLGGGM